MTEWKRPDNIPFPSIWRTFEGKKEINGIKRKYWVQDVTEEYADAFLGYMTIGLLGEEALCKYSKIIEDTQSEQEIVELWRNSLKEKLALICLTKNEKGEVQIVGGNFTFRAYKGEHFDLDIFKGENIRKVILTAEHVYQMKDIYTELNTDQYLTALGLYVLPEFRGEGIGVEILKARRELCLAVGLSASATLFTSPTSQHIAAKARFKDFVEITYEDLEKENPECSFPGITEVSKYLKFMCIRYD
ncbi:hypothetical protein NQ314_018108 [Rhamnusium bicolor]|uniref:N-acetyltransferase domain-containing protein n=1 Tax=Rhamnusium bicolor TaxID=1586634 RepID=A0AAV8WR80_9CUCU|nr:hypothetical protein NQ314_018108 [Rhamnusium bicolor]